VTNRPYFNLDVGRLENAFRTSANDIPTLKGLLEELEHRDTARAKTLKQEIAQRLLTVLEQRNQVRSIHARPTEVRRRTALHVRGKA
jgi:hypothetical protein